MGKRVLLFILTNVLIIGVMSVIFSFTGIGGYLTERGIDYSTLLVFCTLWGFGGAILSLALSKVMAKWLMKVKIIKPQSASGLERKLLDTVYSLARKANLPKMPDVGIYDSPEVNAFATGRSKSNSMVAVSTGLLNRLEYNELEGVLGHEIAHIANGDMVTMTLIQGVVNAFTMFLARVVAYFVASFLRDEDEGEGISGILYFVLVIAFDIIFSILGSIVVAYFSRIREFKADKGGAQLAGKSNMINALEKLRSTLDLTDSKMKEVATLKISNKGRLALFSTHPPLEERIRRLQKS